MGQKQKQVLDGPKNKQNVAQWASRLKSWISTSEPSAQALKKHRKIVFHNAGVSLSDPQAGAKFQ